jgi:hypothetical protein
MGHGFARRYRSIDEIERDRRAHDRELEEHDARLAPRDRLAEQASMPCAHPDVERHRRPFPGELVALDGREAEIVDRDSDSENVVVRSARGTVVVTHDDLGAGA